MKGRISFVSLRTDWLRDFFILFERRWLKTIFVFESSVWYGREPGEAFFFLRVG